MKIISEKLLNDTSHQAQSNQRGRMHYNFHQDGSAPINRLLNALEPDTYIRPHRHFAPDKEEIFIVLRGKIAFFTFNENGSIKDKLIVAPTEGIFGLEMEAGIWHSLIVLEKNTVIYDIKEGPFAPLSDENFAPWSPRPEEKEQVEAFIRKLTQSAYPYT